MVLLRLSVVEVVGVERFVLLFILFWLKIVGVLFFDISSRRRRRRLCRQI